jgi:stringent starvation protein B
MLDESMVMVHLDTRVDGVDVPDDLHDDPMLALNLSHRFGLEVFEIGPFGVKASLGFGDSRHLCVLPWAAIWSMTSTAEGKRFVFPDAVPPELMAAAQHAAEALADVADDEIPDVVESIVDEPLELSVLEPDTAQDAASEAKRPTLRIIK